MKYNYKLIKKDWELIAELDLNLDLGETDINLMKDKITAWLIFSNIHSDEHPEWWDALFADIMNSELINTIENMVSLERIRNDYNDYLIENE